jgi:4-hydroxythreonine-4-phosphate dehydrogenase
MTRQNLAPLVLTPGDPEGIGPEVTWKAIQKLKLPAGLNILCVGSEAAFKKLGAPIIHFDLQSPPKKTYAPPNAGRKPNRPSIWLLPAPETTRPENFLPGFQAGWSIEKATELVMNGIGSALITGPISKERLNRGGFSYPGHTEFLAALCKAQSVTMMLANEVLRVAMVTTHLPLSQVAQSIRSDDIVRAVHQTIEGLQQFWGISLPKIGVAALNPHAGEAGLFGREEIDVITPTIRALQSDLQHKCELSGPFPADTLFAKHVLETKKKRFDAIICMYHDQGLIPVKLLDFHQTVNITLGLPIIRTSVDHGIGSDIAGQGIADPSSLCAAIQLATSFVKRRKKRLLQ